MSDILKFQDSDEFICVLSVLYSGEARVKTEVQAGPLYRVLGSPLYITCSVSGFRNENTDKHFEFRMTKPSNPNRDIQIISSNDDNFGYSNHLIRVRKNEIALKRLSPNSVRFEIKSLLKADEGEYECTAVNLEGAYDGEYSAKTVVKVIEDSLSVSSSASTPLSLNEGEALTLTCLASSSTSQHTHLSVAWYLHKDGQEDAQPIISLNRDFTLSPGQGFERRYQAGLIRLDKWGEAAYNLQMAEVEPSDQGRIYCQAQEWIQDPDGSWYIIIQKNAEEMTLTVKATENRLSVKMQQAVNVAEGGGLHLSCKVDGSRVTVGEKLELMCRVRGPHMPVTVTWSVQREAKTPDTILTLSPNGTISWSADQNHYQLRVESRKTEVIYYLLVIASNQLAVIVNNPGTASCKNNENIENAGIKTIVSLDRNSIVMESKVDLGQRISMRRSKGPTFELTIRQARISDNGSYTCKVGEWLQDPRGEWYLLSTVSKSTVLTITEPGEYIYFSYFRNMFTCHIQLAQK
uniref:Ig-like domain-containing protein n=1 Tax=Oreochromis niloticus TaxID=8128 RepID=A0A669BER0_ORENI